MSAIFVVGTGRSGTSLLRTMLDAHPDLHLTHEASFYVDPLGGRLADDGRAWFDRYRRSFSFAWLGVDPAAVHDRLSAQSAPRRRDAVAAVLAAAGEAKGARRVGDKTPAHSQHLGTIVEEHPGARIVHVVRDPRRVVTSMARMPWAASSHALNARFCQQQVRAVLAHPGEVCHVRLEDLVADPEAELRRVLDHVELPWDPAVLDPAARDPDSLPPFPWFQEALRPVEASPPAPVELSPAWIRIVERTSRTTMERFGYEPTTDLGPVARSDRVRARLVDLPQVVATAARGARLARLGLRKELPPAQEVQDAVLSLNPDAWRHHGGVSIPSVPDVR